MKQIFFGLLACVAFTACNNVRTEAEKNIREGGDTIAKANIVTASKPVSADTLTPMADKMIYAASGSEPGWFAHIYPHKFRFVMDYGKDSLIINKDFSDMMMDEPKTFVVINNVDGKSNNLKVVLENKTCTDASGMASPQTVHIELNGKSYNGCGHFIK